jgi:hypothetical protein
MGYVLKDGSGEIEAKKLDPASSSAEQLAAWCGGVVSNGGMAYATLTLPNGEIVHSGDWVLVKDGVATMVNEDKIRELAYLPEPTEAELAAKAAAEEAAAKKAEEDAAKAAAQEAGVAYVPPAA